MTTSAFNTAVRSALTAASKYGAAIAELQAIAKGDKMSPEDVRAALLKPVAAYYGHTLIAKTRGEGFTLDKEGVNYEATKKALQRLTADVVGKSTAQKDELDVPAHIAKLAAQLVAACAEYESAGRLLATAVAQAKAK